MKKALQISLAKTLFTIEEDAYTRLENYLAAVRKHFASTPGSAEIINDIEASVAEQLLEQKGSIVTIERIESILAKMGSVEDFDDGMASGKSDGSGSTVAGRKLYRNTDDVIIAGVASGIAAYFGWETFWVRLGFFGLVFLNGFGLLLYIVLWVIMPGAKSAAQKLEMTGTPVTLENLSETVRERVEEIRRDKGGTLAKIASIPAQLIAGIGRVLGPVLRIMLGLFMTLVSLVALISILIFSGFLMSGTAMISTDVPLAIAYPGALQALAVINFMLVGLIPVVAVLLGGIALIFKRQLLSLTSVMAMIGVWFVAVLVSSFSIAKGIDNYRAYQETAPAYQAVSQTIPLEGEFEALSIARDVDVEVRRGEEVSLVASGRAREIASLTTRVENGTLYISRASLEDHFCLFCGVETPTLILTVPSLSAISGTYGSRVDALDFGALETLEIELSYGARANIEAELTSLSVQLRTGSDLTLEGSAETAQMSAVHGSRISAEDFKIVEAELEASYGASIDADVSAKLKATASSGANISYDGTPEADVHERQGGSVTAHESQTE